MKFTKKQVKEAAEQLKYTGNLEQLRIGMNTEEDEHRNVTHGSPVTAAKIAIAHMKEFPKADYYKALFKMENNLKKSGK